MILFSILIYSSIIDHPKAWQWLVDQTLRLFREYPFLATLKQIYWKEALTQVVYCDFCNFFQNTYFVNNNLWVAVSVYCQASINLEKSLLVCNLLLIHLTQLCQKYKNKRFWFFYKFEIKFIIIFNCLWFTRFSELFLEWSCF